MERDSWSELVVESRATPPQISDTKFREWMSERRIFVSSVMDAEMIPARQAVRERITRLGGHPEMWEQLAPRDQHSDKAYLEGVARSDIFVLLLGHSYGVSDETGFSPTHKENNLAQQLHIYRLLFQPDNVSRSARDGKLNRLVDSLYHEVSGGKYADPDDLANQLERQLRALASAQEAHWVKLGNLVFPGTVRTRSSSGRTTITISARLRQYAVRQHIMRLSQQQPRNLTLTWGVNAYPVRVDDVIIEGEAVSEDAVTVVCQPTDRHRPQAAWGLMGVTIQSGSRAITPADQAQIWIRRAIFGQPPESTGDALLDQLNMPATPTLPEVLRGLNAQGWFAEGITRLYLVEKLQNQFAASFSNVRIGPATATGVRVEFIFSLPGHDSPPISMEGVVPIA